MAARNPDALLDEPDDWVPRARREIASLLQLNLGAALTEREILGGERGDLVEDLACGGRVDGHVGRERREWGPVGRAAGVRCAVRSVLLGQDKYGFLGERMKDDARRFQARARPRLALSS